MHTQIKQPDQKFGLANVIQGLKDILRYGSEYKGRLIFIFFLIVVSSSIDAAGPYIWGRVIDSISAHKTINLAGYVILEALGILFIYFTLLVIKSFADLKKGLEGRWVQENIRISYNARGFRHLFRLPLTFHKNAKSGEVTEKITKASRAMGDIFSDAIIQSFPQFITALIMFFFVVSTNIYMGITVSLALFGYIYFSAKEISPTAYLQRQVNAAYGKVNGIITDGINNIRSIKDSVTEDYEYARIDKGYKEGGLTKWYQLVQIHRYTGAMQNRIRIVAQASVLVISIYLISKGEMTVGTMVAYNTYALMIFGPLSNIINNWKTIQNGIIAIEEAETILSLPTENYHPTQKQDVAIEGNINFKHISFYYDENKPVLKNINIEIKKGDTVALVGESGVGKSTFIDLLSAYHFPTEGDLIIDGVNIKNIDLNTLRKHIAVVSQEISLFNDTIKYNLSYGSFDKTDEEIKKAATQAHCADFIEQFPEKWDQIVGEKGMKLSVGQKQRVGIARAILRDPKILILDEPTSALDAGSEKIVTESFKELMKGRTTFIVAHRFSTVRRANKILVFKGGEIIEQGIHEDLIKIPNGEYRRLYELQIGLHE